MEFKEGNNFLLVLSHGCLFNFIANLVVAIFHIIDAIIMFLCAKKSY